MGTVAPKILVPDTKSGKAEMDFLDSLKNFRHSCIPGNVQACVH